MAPATAAFLFRQFWATLTDELSSRWIDGGIANALLLRHRFSALQNQSGGAVSDHLYLRLNRYLWSLLIVIDVDLGTTVAGINDDRSGEGTPKWNPSDGEEAAIAIPPVVIVFGMQRAHKVHSVDREIRWQDRNYRQ